MRRFEAIEDSGLRRRDWGSAFRAAAFLLACGLLEATSAAQPVAKKEAFSHPGLLHSQADLDRIRTKVAAGAEPWAAGWKKLIDNRHAALAYKPNPKEVVVRGFNGKQPENYAALFNDAAAAYALALRWRISGDAAYADKAVEILNAWGGSLRSIEGTSDRFLASGIYGCHLANAAELLRDHKGWKRADFERFQKMMLDVFYAMNHDFLVRHNGAKIDHYWANWDLANLSSMTAIGVLCDRRDIYDEAVEYFKHGAGNGSIRNLVWKLHDGGLGQIQESGRDQGHSTMCIGLAGAICQMAWNQGDDLFGYDDDRVLKGAEYVARYNLGHVVPFAPYTNSDVHQPVISDKGRGELRPIWELVYNHYVVRKGRKAPHVEAWAKKVRPEGGGGDYGPNSGGFDQLGYGTLMFSLE